MIEFSIVPPGRGREAYQWHRGFAAQNPHILPRPWEDYKSFADDEQLWCARDETGDFLGLAYYAFDRDIWELGGLMVASSERKSGLGSTLIRLVLGHLLYMENPLSLNHKVVAHIHADNAEVIPLAEKVLGFRKAASIQREWYSTSGQNVGMVTGHEFELVKPSSLITLAEWCVRWENRLFDGREAKITFVQEAQNLKLWADAFLEMAR
jgi:hypothetical protein